MPANCSCGVLLTFIPFLCMAASTITTIESLKFDLATIEAATHKFSDDNKLGGGGFGEVYQVWN
jgi:hypothetical protein